SCLSWFGVAPRTFEVLCSFVEPVPAEIARGLATVRFSGRGAGLAVPDHVVEKSFQLSFGQCSNFGSLHLAVLEYHQGRNSTNAVLLRRCSIGIDIHLGHF